MIGKKQWTGILAMLMALALTVACSKKLMPPEIEQTGSVAESELEEIAKAPDAMENVGPDKDFPLGSTPSDDSGYLREENFAENGSPQSEDGSSFQGNDHGRFDGTEDSGFLREENLNDMGTAENSSINPETGELMDSASAGSGDFPGSSPSNPNNNGEIMDSGSMAEAGEMGGVNSGASGSGATGSVGPNPFAEGAPTESGTGSEMDKNGGFQEARLFSFRPTSELKDIHFRFDKYDLDERSRLILKQNADFLKQHPGVKVEIQGHCDERGTNNYNLALGQRRANSTKNFLASMGISENRLHIISYGEEKPFCMESSESCWWRNRRAHFMVAE